MSLPFCFERCAPREMGAPRSEPLAALSSRVGSGKWLKHNFSKLSQPEARKPHKREESCAERTTVELACLCGEIQLVGPELHRPLFLLCWPGRKLVRRSQGEVSLLTWSQMACLPYFLYKEKTMSVFIFAGRAGFPFWQRHNINSNTAGF